MTRRARSVWPRVLGLALLASTTGVARADRPPSTTGNRLVLTGGTIYPAPGEGPIVDGVVVVLDGKTVAVGRRDSVRIPQGARVLDCSGLTIMAGFWNSHVHFFERKWSDAAALPASELARQLRDMLTRYGFTSVFDLGSFWDNTRTIRDRIESGEIAGPRIRTTGETLIVKGAGMPSEMVLRLLGVMPPAVADVADGAEALAAAKRVLDRGADGLKIQTAAQMPPFPTMPDEAIKAAVDEAHRRNKPVFAHPTHRDGLLAAVRGGADVIAHTTPPSGPWDEDVLKAMGQAKVALIPTLQIWIYFLRHDRASLAEERARIVTGQLRAWIAAGGVVLFGTDVGGLDSYDPGDEYALMARAGMTFRQILAALTTAPAERFGESRRLGRIAPGLAADLVALNGDPSRDVRAFAAVRYTIRGGSVICCEQP